MLSTHELWWHGFEAAAILLTSAVVSYCATPSAIRWAPSLGIVDRPGPGKIHSTPIPRSGGLAIYLGTTFGLLGVWVLPWGKQLASFELAWWPALWVASSLMLLVGLVDDRYALSARQKLLGQMCAVVVLYAFNIRIDSLFGFLLPIPLDFLLTALWIVLVTNAFNLVDGLDGLCTGLVAIGTLGIAGTLIFRDLGYPALIALAIIGACAGFLPYNRHPARVFLGDGGSNFLGFIVAALVVVTGSKGSALSYLWAPMLALAIPLLDTMLAIWRRGNRYLIRRIRGRPGGMGVMHRDLEHLHHRLLILGVSQRNVVASLYLANALFVLIGIATLPTRSNSWLVLIPLSLGAIVLVLRSVRLPEIKESARLIGVLLLRPTLPVVALFVFVVIDLLAVGGAVLLSLRISHPDFSWSVVFAQWVARAPMWCAAGLLFALSCEGALGIIRRSFSRRVAWTSITAALVMWSIVTIRQLTAVQSPVSVAMELSGFVILSVLFMGTFRLALLFLDRWVQQTSKNDLLIVPSDEAEVEELRHLSSRYARYPTHYGRVVASVRRGRGVLGAIAPSAEIGTHNSAR